MPSVIIVSLIDILAILLIFVIVTTTFRRDQPEIVIKLPESTTATAAPNPTDPVVLSISPEEKIFLDGKEVPLEALGAALAQLLKTAPERPLALSADRKASFGLIIRVIDILKEAGVKNLPAFMEQKP
jgi:biopolymer transport protein ExbD